MSKLLFTSNKGPNVSKGDSERFVVKKYIFPLSCKFSIYFLFKFELNLFIFFND